MPDMKVSIEELAEQEQDAIYHLRRYFCNCEPEEKLCSQVLSSEQLLKEDSGSAQLCQMMQIMTQFQTYVRLLEETTAQALADRGIIFDIPAEILNDTTFNINKRKHEYLRFGKRKHDYLRFGKRKHEYLRFG
ncbi:FMRFamide-like neuropeptides 14 [Trichinella zimbabwensis]|uniref:FMRFamide-like neuropeptides 14 n=1 Tax=Trichinella zimbabwensis TaxID=268475 RepID=A0A0V1I0A0_9BILA|nr:FMRFamide-like neuropeptides 14 [Trichinella zimbabwensis]